MDKSELLVSLQEKFQEWEALLDEVGDERMEQPGINDTWSMKDMVAHLTDWNRYLVSRLKAAFPGETGPYPPWPSHLESDDEINAWIFEANHGSSASEVLEQMHMVHQQLIDVIEDLPDAIRIELVDPKYLLVWVGDERFHVSEFFDHFTDDHVQDVRAWLASEGKDTSN